MLMAIAQNIKKRVLMAVKIAWKRKHSKMEQENLNKEKKKKKHAKMKKNKNTQRKKLNSTISLS